MRRGAGIPAAVQLANGSERACVISGDGEAPVRAELPSPATRVSVGEDHTCALDEAGDVWCWGSDQEGQLGQGRLGVVDAFTPVVGLSPR